MVMIIALAVQSRRRREAWKGMPVATWCSEWICRMGRGLVPHIIIIPGSPVFSIPQFFLATRKVIFTRLLIHLWPEALRDITNRATKKLVLNTLQTNGTFRREAEAWKKQACRNRNQKCNSNATECERTLAFSTLGSPAAMLTVGIDVKTKTQSVAMSSLNIVHRTTVGQGQGTW